MAIERSNVMCETQSSSRMRWRNEYKDMRLEDISGRRFVRELFFNCQIGRVKGTTFDHCSLLFSRLEPKRLEDILGLTVTLNCFSFENVELNDLAFDAFLHLLSLTKGNDRKRAALRNLISDRNRELFRTGFPNIGESLVG